jgi:hypothetical protein
LGLGTEAQPGAPPALAICRTPGRPVLNALWNDLECLAVVADRQAQCAKPLRFESFRGPPETSQRRAKVCRTPAVGRRPWPAGAPSGGHGAASVGETHLASAARERQTGRGPLGWLHTSARGCLSAGC